MLPHAVQTWRKRESPAGTWRVTGWPHAEQNRIADASRAGFRINGFSWKNQFVMCWFELRSMLEAVFGSLAREGICI